jgi:hypothetical protein
MKHSYLEQKSNICCSKYDPRGSLEWQTTSSGLLQDFWVHYLCPYSRCEEEKAGEQGRKKCVFLGVSDHSKAYKLYNPNTKRIVISHDVIFDEDQFWSWHNSVPNKPLVLDTDIDNDNEEGLQAQPTIESSQLVDDQRPLRARTRPAWMADYEVAGIAQDEDPLTYFALFSDCDPTTFEVAVKTSTWR